MTRKFIKEKKTTGCVKEEKEITLKKSELEEMKKEWKEEVKQEIKQQLMNNSSKPSERSSESKQGVSRREFLKKLGVGMIGFGTLGLSSASALDIRSNNLQFYGGSGETEIEFEVGKDGKIQAKNHLNMNSHKIIGLASPSSDYHAATKKYVDDNVGVTAGDGLTQSSGTLNVEPADFAGHGLEDDGADNLRLDGAAIGTGINGGDGTNLSLDESVIKDGGAKEIDAQEFAGGSGTAGQFLKTDGANASWASPPTPSISDGGTLVLDSPDDISFDSGVTAQDQGDNTISVYIGQGSGSGLNADQVDGYHASGLQLDVTAADMLIATDQGELHRYNIANESYSALSTGYTAGNGVAIHNNNDGFAYLFNDSGNAYEYDISADSITSLGGDTTAGDGISVTPYQGFDWPSN